MRRAARSRPWSGWRAAEVPGAASRPIGPIGRTGLTGRFVPGGPWERFGRYNAYHVTRDDGAVLVVRAHAGELVPGSTEDLAAFLSGLGGELPRGPMTLELDPTYACASVSCGEACFSAAYRAQRPRASIGSEALGHAIRAFADAGGRVLRFDGGGDPLLHPDVRSGDAVRLGADLGLKTTILTSGDLLPATDWRAIVDADCYLRVSLNAHSTAVRRQVHGNKVDMDRLWEVLAAACAHARARGRTPVGTTFLLTPDNHAEVALAARRARDIGVSHFSVRRVLGPEALRRPFGAAARAALPDLLEEVRALDTDDFRVFVPARDVAEPDLSPRAGDITASSCWQSVFKTVLEPAAGEDEVRVQLCGRYRGSGVGQAMQLPPVAADADPATWDRAWSRSFTVYPVRRPDLVRTCVSCIDRGFIQMMDGLVRFTELGARPFTIEHLWLDPDSLARCEAPDSPA